MNYQIKIKRFKMNIKQLNDSLICGGHEPLYERHAQFVTYEVLNDFTFKATLKFRDGKFCVHRVYTVRNDKVNEDDIEILDS